MLPPGPEGCCAPTQLWALGRKLNPSFSALTSAAKNHVRQLLFSVSPLMQSLKSKLLKCWRLSAYFCITLWAVCIQDSLEHFCTQSPCSPRAGSPDGISSCLPAPLLTPQEATAAVHHQRGTLTAPDGNSPLLGSPCPPSPACSPPPNLKHPLQGQQKSPPCCTALSQAPLGEPVHLIS